jgi:hypothetical protein
MSESRMRTREVLQISPQSLTSRWRHQACLEAS